MAGVSKVQYNMTNYLEDNNGDKKYDIKLQFAWMTSGRDQDVLNKKKCCHFKSPHLRPYDIYLYREGLHLHLAGYWFTIFPLWIEVFKKNDWW